MKQCLRLFVGSSTAARQGANQDQINQEKEMQFTQPVRKSVMLMTAVALILSIGAARQVRAQAFSSDITLHETTTGSGMGQGKGTQTITSYFGKNAMKRVSSEGTDTVIRFEEGKIITIDNKKKTYSEVTIKQIQDMMEKVTSEVDQNKEAMEAMRKMMGQTMAAFSVTKVGPGGPIAGYATEKYQVTGPMEMEIWAAPDLKVPAIYYDVMKARTPRNPMFDMGKMYDEMKKIDGIPLKSVTVMKMMGREIKTLTEVSSVEKGAIPASTFEIPAGYKQVKDKFEQ